LKAKEAERKRAERLAALVAAYKEGHEAGGKEAAKLRMRAKFDELNPEETTDEQ